MATRAANIVVMSLLLFGVVLAGCAKRPATTQASAPAPTAPPPAATTPAQPSAPPAPSMAAPTRPAPAPAAAAPTTTARPSPKEFTAIADLKDIHFAFDKYDIRPGDAKVLDANAAWLKSHGDYLVLVEGHCDERGTNEYNLALGERRAKSTMNYLVSQGVQASRITIISYGEERPQCAEKNEGCWSKNRRSHFLVKPR
ncbi:MAG: peptidoglycan-associated lipoprotein [Candidatus Rokubacteria bacterium RIFCSPHIGHO2_12_FULL_73_22]|nr:MAG: peptidoglycan-associated lipoprotein [Candidatus Rokubacteria bacterium RIFCSPHIGHO2_12_FULL_73_22]OGL01861.1 MAG: peptidoglycan-associated lipoprotein [Candidatus Rokubacteria bacterium RIFCSPHIGHO2_02_FULL_73_26]OGL08685.1 MAG: peptidoglycan-associated lipoprotein [Candidatus Rokubacteria bacterium RIFCSPLOWO2_02_FULL_73_56]